MNKKGLLVISDIMWFFIFVIAAALLFFFLFNRLEGDEDPRVINSDEMQQDADFIAISLLRMKNNNEYFSETVRNVIENGSEENLRAYEMFLNTTFKDNNMWIANAKETNPPIRYAVILRQGNTLNIDTCKEYTFEQVAKTLCDYIQTGLVSQPTPNQRMSATGSDAGGIKTNIEVGYAYLPTNNGPATVLIMIERGQR